MENTNSQYNLPEIGKKIAYRANRSGVAQRFSDPAVQTSIAADLSLIDFYDTLLGQLELFITSQAKQQDHHSFYLLRVVSGLELERTASSGFPSRRPAAPSVR